MSPDRVKNHNISDLIRLQISAYIQRTPPLPLRINVLFSVQRLMKMAQRTELPDFLDICAVFQGMCHNNPEHLDAVNTLLEKLAK